MTAPPPPQRPVLRRSSTDRVLGGVAGGLARTFDIEPVVVRIITVVVAFGFPPALVAYLAAWLLIARDDEPSRPPTGGIALREAGGVGTWVGIAVLAVAGLAILDDPFGGGFNLLPLVLVGIGVALWTRGGPRPHPDQATSAQTDWPAAATDTTTTTGAVMSTTAQQAPTEPVSAGPVPGGTPGGPPSGHPHVRRSGPPPVPPTPRPRSPLGGITIALALIATGVVAALDQVESLPLDAGPTHLAAVALLVLGLGQLVGAFWGRARWLSLVAMVLIPPVLLGLVLREADVRLGIDGDLDLGDGIGERVLRVDGAEELPDEIRLLAGEVTVDLQDWRPDRAQLDAIEVDDSDLYVSVGAGQVVLTTPTDVPWRLLADVGLGDVTYSGDGFVPGRGVSEDTVGPLEVVRTGGPQDGPVLDIIVDIRLGELDLRTPDMTTVEELS